MTKPTMIEESFLKHKHHFAIFQDMSDEDILNVVERIEFIRLTTGETLFKQEECSSKVFYVVSGACGVYVDDCLVGRVEVGSTIGEFASITKDFRLGTVRAQKDSILFGFYVRREAMDEHPKAFGRYLFNLSKDLIGKVKKINAKLLLDAVYGR